MGRRARAGVVAACCLLALLGSACGSSPGGTQTATWRAVLGTIAPTVTPAPNRLTVVAGVSPSAAADMIAREVTGATPLLMLNAVPEDWRGELTQPDATSFTVTFRSPDGTKRVLLALVVANLPTPDAKTQQTQPNFHGDPRSLYQVQDPTVPAGDRFLLWTEKGTWATEPGYGGVPYYLMTHGLTDGEFWQMANSLHAIQR